MDVAVNRWCGPVLSGSTRRAWDVREHDDHAVPWTVTTGSFTESAAATISGATAELCGAVREECAMRMFLLVLWLGSCAAAQCDVPERALSKVSSYLTYENGLAANLPWQVRFSVLRSDDRVWFRMNNPRPGYDPGQRPVYVYGTGRRIDTVSCPADRGWVNCVANSTTERAGIGEDTRACEFTLNIGPWKPSPDNEKKRQLAGEIANEIRAFGYENVKAMYVRDFNLTDPEIQVYTVDDRGKPDLLGCHFDASAEPHCGWHRFGQAPLTELKRQIMERPYRLYPPPMGR